MTSLAVSGGKMVDDQAVEGLRASVSGNVVTPADSAYDGARAVWNAMIDRHPALIVQAQDPVDVGSGERSHNTFRFNQNITPAD
jgi:hypothetical protein